MAQLTDDCFAFNGPLLPVAEAEQLIGVRVIPVSGRETMPLHAALGRVLAADLAAPVNLPPFDNSAVDGYAVRGDDIDAAREQRLVIVDRVAAGHAASHAVKAGEAVRIFTGAPMPIGADTVFMQEDCLMTHGEFAEGYSLIRDLQGSDFLTALRMLAEQEVMVKKLSDFKEKHSDFKEKHKGEKSESVAALLTRAAEEGDEEAISLLAAGALERWV